MCKECENCKKCTNLVVQGADCYNQPLININDNITDYSTDNGAYIEAPRLDSDGNPICAGFRDRRICSYCGRSDCMMETGGTSCG